MANTPVEFLSPPGLTLTLELFPHGSDDVANGAGDVCTEATNREGLYTATVTEALAGWHTAHVYDGGGNLIYAGYVYLHDTTAVHRCGEWVDVGEVEGSSGVLAAIATAVWAYVVENGKSAVAFLRVIKSAVAAKLAGAATTEVTTRDDADTKDRITATVDEDGNRTSVVIDGD